MMRFCRAIVYCHCVLVIVSSFEASGGLCVLIVASFYIFEFNPVT